MSYKQTDELQAGEYVRLQGFGNTPPAYRQKLLSLGLTKGTEARIIRIAPLGCPIQLEVRHSHLALRKEEACDLVWELV